MAALLFLRVAEGAVDDDRTVQAVMLVLESINVLGSNFGRTDCFDEIEAVVSRAITRLCSPELVAQHPARAKTCTLLGRIEWDIERLKAPHHPIPKYEMKEHERPPS